MKGKLEKIIVLPNLLVAMTICTVSDPLRILTWSNFVTILAEIYTAS